MLVEVIDWKGFEQEGCFSPMSVMLWLPDLKTPGTPSYERLRQLLGRAPDANELRRPGSARDGRVTWT